MLSFDGLKRNRRKTKARKAGKFKTTLRKKKKVPLTNEKEASKENVSKVDVAGIDESTALSRKKKLKASKFEDVEVAQISLAEDCSKGMKKWLDEYQKSRPGLRILQQDIDRFMTDYEVQKEKERNEKNAELLKDGFQPVEHHKGRKKTTDSESGTTVGSVSQAAVMNNMMKKKNKEISLDFYRFQKHETRRNEIMTLQSKFEQDKKRLQQLRAARKFKPF